MDSTKIVGEKIKSLRETKEISVAELAVRSGLAEEQIERIENNVDLPSLAPLIKIARALGVRLGTFLDDQEEQGAVICPNKAITKPIFNISHIPANTIPTDLSALNQRKITAAYSNRLSFCITHGNPCEANPINLSIR